ncbi:MAG: DUF1464 family protein [Thermoprotei archaeon]
MDQGSVSYDIVAIDDSGVEPIIVLEKSFSTRFVKERPNVVVDTITSLGAKIDSVVLPSGFGTTLKHINDLDDQDFFEMSLKPAGGSSLEKVIRAVRNAGVNAYVIPAVKHLPTVPTHRKLNRVDLGTSDKVCVAALGVYTQMRAKNIRPEDAEFVLAELGSSFNAFIAVKNGKIVDGVGGTNSWMGIGSRGCVDGEVAALMGEFSKEDAYSGGVLYLASAGNGNVSVEEVAVYAEQGQESARLACEAYVEGVVRDVSAIVAASGINTREVFLSGRISRIKYFYEALQAKLSGYTLLTMDRMKSIVKEGAIGAAIIANGLVGGVFKPIVENLNITNASGHVLDHVHLPQKP